VAVAVHHFLEEAEDEGVREALLGMQVCGLCIYILYLYRYMHVYIETLF
jgi:hypothetical protein